MRKQKKTFYSLVVFVDKKKVKTVSKSSKRRICFPSGQEKISKINIDKFLKYFIKNFLNEKK